MKLNNKQKIGIMQGRLSKSINGQIQAFPALTWRDEFKIARQIGFDVIEWIFDGEQNPILFSSKIKEIEILSKENNITVNSICADYFMVKKLFSESKNNIENNIEILNKLIVSANQLGIKYIEIPLVDSSSLKTNKDKNELISSLDQVFPIAEKYNVNIVLETDLNPQKFKGLLEDMANENIMANYDSGNSASLGYDSKEEIRILKKWIKNVHVKDRKFQGKTVPFGTGDVNFVQFFSTLFEINYSGDLIIQGARYPENEYTPEQTCQIYKKFVKDYLDKYYK